MIVAGFGYRAQAQMADLRAALNGAMDAASGGPRPDALAAVRSKAGGPVRALADALHLPLIVVEDDHVRGIDTTTQSPRIHTRFGTGSLAEATALVAAGPNAHLMSQRAASPNGMATAALARTVKGTHP